MKAKNCPFCLNKGVGASVHGKHIIATEKTVLGMPETSIGLFPDVGCVHMLSRLPGKLGLYMGLTGHFLTGKEVYNAGIATHYIQSSQIDALTNELFQIEKQADIVTVLDKFNKEKKDELDLTRINKAFSASTIEEILENLKAENTLWAKEQVKRLLKMSPTSLKVTTQYIDLASSQKFSLKKTLEMDFNLWMHFLNGKDFYEGVRSLLIEKDNKPKWTPSSIETVDDKKIGKYFEITSDCEKLDLN
jgi:3-hydroxyisobutyryl-CoA hydrolase